MRDDIDQPTMTGAEFRCARQLLGLSTEWLARTWSNDLRTVQRWEQDDSVPDGVAEQIREMLDEADDALEDYAARLEDEEEWVVPRTDKDVKPDDPYPSSWHRAIAARLMVERPDVRLVYPPRVVEDINRIAKALELASGWFPTETQRVELRRCSSCDVVHLLVVSEPPGQTMYQPGRVEHNVCGRTGNLVTGHVVPETART